MAKIIYNRIEEFKKTDNKRSLWTFKF